MAKDDRQTIESIYERWNRNEGDLALELVDEDADIRHLAALVGTPRPFRGPHGMARAAAELNEAFKDIHWHPEAWVSEGDWPMARIGVRATGRASGASHNP